MGRIIAVKGIGASQSASVQRSEGGGAAAESSSPAMVSDNTPSVSLETGPRAGKSKRQNYNKKSIMNLVHLIADDVDLPPENVKKVLDALLALAAKSLKQTNTFKLHGLVQIKMIKIKARAASKRKMFNKEVLLSARPESEKLTAQALKPLYEAIKKLK